MSGHPGDGSVNHLARVEQIFGVKGLFERHHEVQLFFAATDREPGLFFPNQCHAQLRPTP